MGSRTILLTGDTKTVADVVGKQLNITEVQADLLPEDKQRYVRQLVKEGRTVAMVGDGINDAPALVEATIGWRWGQPRMWLVKAPTWRNLPRR